MPEHPTPDERPASPFPAMEAEVHAYWKKQQIFERSLEERPTDKTYVFYDGPPFATGLPHYGHLLQSAIKDAIPRYWTMKGMRVPRRWGWDCHGLPIENLIEKQLALGSKRAIEEHGIDKFNDACRMFEFASRFSNSYINSFCSFSQR
jgi:isoleucyl-tRNA synthetase